MADYCKATACKYDQQLTEGPLQFAYLEQENELETELIALTSRHRTLVLQTS